MTGIAALEFIGQASLTTGYAFASTQVGGLSGIDYDAARDRYYAISDDRSQIDPARFYTLSIDLGDGALNDGDVQITAVTSLLDATGNPFGPATLDPESIRPDAATQTRYWPSEGDANALQSPWEYHPPVSGEHRRCQQCARLRQHRR